MGQSTNGVLVYGYNIGGGEDQVHIAGLGRYENWIPPDITEDEVADFDEEGFRDWAARKLMASAGHQVNMGDYFDPADTKKHTGVWFESHCSGEYPMYLLVAYATSAYRGDPEDVDFTELERRRVEEDWDGKLEAALRILGIPGLIYPHRYGQEEERAQKPRWILASYWG